MFYYQIFLFEMLYLLVASCVLLCALQCHSASCPDKKTGLEDKYIDGIMEKFNEIRKKIRDGENYKLPQAKEMPDLEWDKDLAAKAQAWADKCRRETDDGRGDVGQIVTFSSTGKEDPDWENILNNIYNTFIFLDLDSIDSYKKNRNSDDITQTLWAKTTKVGCGYLRYKPNDRYTHLYVCDFLPRGNIEGEPVYIRK